jgi:nucleotide-binding universal stress UspA family protein
MATPMPVAPILAADDLERENKNEPALAVQLAGDLALALLAEVHVVHVYKIPELAPLPQNVAILTGPYIDALMVALDAESEAVRERDPGISVVPRVEKGNAIDVLLEDASNDRCQFLVLARTHAKASAG